MSHRPAKATTAGGWSDIGTFFDAFPEPDMETLRRVAEDPARMRQAQAGAVDTSPVRQAHGLRLVK